MSILQNAIDSIGLGIEDFKSKDKRRTLSATRNLIAGLLLLIKHKLASLSPNGSEEALIKQVVRPVSDGAGGVIWKGKGKNTIDLLNMRRRCKSLGIHVDWKRIDQIVMIRNDIEHYYTTQSETALRSLIGSSFLVIRDFIILELGDEPHALLGAETWLAMTEVNEVFLREKKECEANIDTIMWGTEELKEVLSDWICPECDTGLIDVTNPGVDPHSVRFKCRGCGKEWDFEEGAVEAVSECYWSANYEAARDGGEPATINCPNCNLEAYVLDEDICLVCGESVARECERCGNEIPASEIDGGKYCGWCAHKIGKGE